MGNRMAAIAMDSWKKEIFEKTLREAGFEWEEHDGLSEGMVIFKVPYDETTFDKLSATVQEAQNAAYRSKAH